MKFKTLGCIVLLVIAMTALIPSCTVSVPGFPPITVTPAQPGQPGEGWTVIGTWTDEDGNVWQLIDTNGDGVPDMVRSPDGKWYKIVPPDHVSIGVTSKLVVTIDGVIVGTLQRIIAAIADDGVFYVITEAIPTLTSTPYPFDGQDAEAWIEEMGLDSTAGTFVAGGFQINQYDSATSQADVTITWSSAFVVPDITGYALAYEMYALGSETNGNPAVLSIHVAGDVEEVVSFLTDLGARSCAISVGGSNYTLETNPSTRTAVVKNSSNTVIHSISF